jgi:hypothetical protein
VLPLPVLLPVLLVQLVLHVVVVAVVLLPLVVVLLLPTVVVGEDKWAPLPCETAVVIVVGMVTGILLMRS